MTVATVLAKVRNILSDEPWSDTINAAYTAPATTFTITDYTELVRGDTLDFQDDGTYDLFLVDATPSSSTVTVGISYDGATNANHSNGARYYKSPRFSSKDIVEALTHIVDTRLFPDVWIMTSDTITPDPDNTVLYELPSDYQSFISLVQESDSDVSDVIYTAPDNELLSVPTSLSSTNKALRVSQWARDDVDATLFYRARPTVSSMTTEMEPIIAIGTAAYLLTTETVPKVDRPDEDDRTGRMRRNATSLWNEFEAEKHNLRTQLINQWGAVKRFKR